LANKQCKGSGLVIRSRSKVKVVQ